MSRQFLLRLLGVILIVVALVMLPHLPVADWLDAIARWSAERPLLGALSYLAAAALAGILMTPGWIPMMLAGLMFGLGKGFVLGALGILLAATTGFLAGRGLLRQWIEQRIAGNRKLSAIDRALGDEAFTIVLLTRLALLIPFNVLNYAYGLTRVRTHTYMLASGIGMLPAVLLYVYLGTLARDISQILDGTATPAGNRWLIAGVALAAIVAVTAIIHRAATRALNEQLERDSVSTE